MTAFVRSKEKPHPQKPKGAAPEKTTSLNRREKRPCRGLFARRSDDPDRQTVNELPQPQVLLTLGLLNLKPAPSRVSM